MTSVQPLSITNLDNSSYLSLIHISQIIRAGMTMQEVVDLLSDEYGWSDSVCNLSAKLKRESIRYKDCLLYTSRCV